MRTLTTWTSEDIALLRVLAASGEIAAAIAKKLSRSPAAIRKRAIILEIRLAKEPRGRKAKGK
jgi:hypothetical protein